MEIYGEEVIVDMYGCHKRNFNRKNITAFCDEMSNVLGMTPCTLHFWDDVGVPEEERQTDPKKTGTSAVQFWLESNLTIHTLDLMGCVYINAFTCKTGMDEKLVSDVCLKYFGGRIAQLKTIERI